MEEVKIYLRLEGEMARRYSQVRRLLGLKNDTEVLRSLINSFWRDHKEEIPPELEHFNLNEHGVLILDRDLDRIIQVYFNPDKILCEYCGEGGCKHVEFALSIREAREILLKKGWKVRWLEKMETRVKS